MLNNVSEIAKTAVEVSKLKNSQPNIEFLTLPSNKNFPFTDYAVFFVKEVGRWLLLTRFSVQNHGATAGTIYDSRLAFNTYSEKTTVPCVSPTEISSLPSLSKFLTTFTDNGDALFYNSMQIDAYGSKTVCFPFLMPMKFSANWVTNPKEYTLIFSCQQTGKKPVFKKRLKIHHYNIDNTFTWQEVHDIRLEFLRSKSDK